MSSIAQDRVASGLVPGDDNRERGGLLGTLDFIRDAARDVGAVAETTFAVIDGVKQLKAKRNRDVAPLDPTRNPEPGVSRAEKSQGAPPEKPVGAAKASGPSWGVLALLGVAGWLLLRKGR